MASSDETCYAAVADELNDGDDVVTLADLDREYVERGAAFAARNGFAWPPECGDYDRYYDWRHNEGSAD